MLRQRNLIERHLAVKLPMWRGGPRLIFNSNIERQLERHIERLLCWLQRVLRRSGNTLC